jgi:hypothetical protein
VKVEAGSPVLRVPRFGVQKHIPIQRQKVLSLPARFSAGLLRKPMKNGSILENALVTPGSFRNAQTSM